MHLHYVKGITDKDFDFGPFASFEAKAKLGRLTGIYGDKLYQDLKTIIDIRNIFAHRRDVHSFSNPDIEKLIRKLKMGATEVAALKIVKKAIQHFEKFLSQRPQRLHNSSETGALPRCRSRLSIHKVFRLCAGMNNLFSAPLDRKVFSFGHYPMRPLLDTSALSRISMGFPPLQQGMSVGRNSFA